MDLDITLRSYDLQTQTLIAVMYLAKLAEGDTISRTLKGYMTAMATYTLVSDNVGYNIGKELETHKYVYQWKIHPFIVSIYSHTKRWQGGRGESERPSH